MKKWIVLLLVLTMVLLLFSCGATPQEKLIGRWTLVSENRNVFTKYLEFYNDGTYASYHPNYNGDFSITNDRIKFDGILVSPLTYSYEI